MDTSFYTAARAARTEQDKMNVISNNVANINTNGYKSKSAVFTDLMYYNMKAPENEQTRLKAGTGVVAQRTNTNFGESGYDATGKTYDYAISGEGFFMVQNPGNNEISYTRGGNFFLSQRGNDFYLATDSGKLVLDRNRRPIRVRDGELQSEIGVYTFNNTNGMQSTGSNEFVPAAKNGEPRLVRNAKIINGTLEMSNVDLAEEMTKTIEASRAYSYALKMVQTSDEVEQTINSLRG